MAERRYVKEAGKVVCHCECGMNKPCPVPEAGPCRDYIKALRVKVTPIEVVD